MNKEKLNKESSVDNIEIIGDVMYKPSKLIEVTKWILTAFTLTILVYLIATRYAGPITLVQFGIMCIFGAIAFILFTKYQAKLVTTNISVTTTDKTESDKQIKFVFYATKETKEKDICVNNIRDIIVITHLKYVKLIDKDNKEVFELSVEQFDDLQRLSQFVIKHTGAYLMSM